MTQSFYEFVRANAESRWDREIRRIVEPSIDRYTADPAELEDFSFSLLYSAVVAWGPDRIAPYAVRIAPLLRPALAARAANQPKSIADLAAGRLASFLACCGCPDETHAITDWLSEIQTSKDEEETEQHWERALAALALDVRPLYRALGGAEPTQPLPLTSSRAFGGDLQGFIRHLGAAVEHAAGFAAIEPAWRDLVKNFKRQEESRQLHRSALFWIGRIIHHRIAGAPLGAVAQWVHEQVAA